MSMLIVIFMSFRGPLRPQVTRYGLHARQVAYATPYTGGSDGFVSSTAAPIASGWSEPSSRAGLSPAVDQRLFTAHVQSRFFTNRSDTAIFVSNSAYAEILQWRHDRSGYNFAHRWGSPLEPNLVRMRSIPRWVRAEWVKCIG